MIGELNEIQINNVLSSQVIGRLACTDGKVPYIVPVTYTYDGESICGQTKEGMKLNILRKNPNVCFEVDIITNINHWYSVIVYGIFEELKDKDAIKAREYLFDKVLPLMTSSTVHAHEHEVTFAVDDINRIKSVMYKIKIEKRTGRFEKK